VQEPTIFDFTAQTLEPLLTTLARIFVHKGDGRVVAVLAGSKPSIAQTDFDNWDGGLATHTITLHIPHRLYAQIEEERELIEKSIVAAVRPLIRAARHDDIGSVLISPELTVVENWREKANSWVAGKGVSNQGRVRSDNIAARSHDGLLFRSEPEIHLYNALKAKGVSVAPLPVFIRGGESYRRIEPDFVILKDGLLMIVEVDGDTVHQETPVEAHTRTTMLMHEGAHIERISSSECDTAQKAQNSANHLLRVFEKLKGAK